MDRPARYLEHFEPGLELVSPWHHVAQDELVDFAQAWDPEPFHVDPEAAARSPFGRLIASSSHLLALRTALVHRFPVRPVVIAGLGLDEVRFPTPLFVGDSVRLEARCLESRASSDPERGIVVMRGFLRRHEDGAQVLSFRETLLLARDPRRGE